MTWIQTKYASLLSPYLRNYKVKGNSLYNFSCPFCGDSATNEFKARGYLFEKEGELKYKCHNCGDNSKFDFFLKRINLGLYKQYKLENFKSSSTHFSKPKHQEVKKQIEEHKASMESCFEPLSEEALMYLKSRQITRIDDLKYTPNMQKLAKFFPSKDLPNDARIIFPIRNRKGNITGISARSLDPKNKLRYVLLKYTEEPLIFGLDKIDIGKKVFVVEGAIDSLHLDNSIAVNGSDLTKVSEFVKKENQILVFDNQPRNKEIINKMLNACDQGYKIVIWPKNLIEKDINAMVISHGIDKVKEWLEKSYNGLLCKAKIIDWRKV